jgi:hypothetical protein
MCRVCLKSASSDNYHSLSHTCEPRPWQLLLVKIKQIIAQYPDNDNYGVERVRLALEQRSVIASKSTVRRAMKKGGLLKRPSHHSVNLTKADADAQKAENLIPRDFTADAPNRKWLTDITQIPCQDGKLYIAPVLDCYNGEIVGLAMDNNMKKGLCIQAFESANADGSGQKHCFSVHYDLLQPYSNLYRQSRRATDYYVSSGHKRTGCLIRKFGVFILCTVLDSSRNRLSRQLWSIVVDYNNGKVQYFTAFSCS